MTEVAADNSAQASDTPQQEMPFAYVAGEAITELPDDLYIPPDALEVFLEAFEGPLDLLLYLIKRQNIDILDVDVALITDQYMAYVELMQAHQFELAAEYLVMASMLAEIKSRMLLPRPQAESEEEEDPRAQLIRRLQEYERYKNAAEDLDALPRVDRDIFPVQPQAVAMEHSKPEPVVELQEILNALAAALRRADMFEHHHIQRETLSTREKMSEVLARVSPDRFVPLLSLLMKDEGRQGVVVTFLAVMELIKESLVDVVQTESYGPIHIKARSE